MIECDCDPMNGIHNIYCIRFKLIYERTQQMYSCGYCNQVFPNESSFLIHTCEKKRMAEEYALLKKQEQIGEVAKRVDRNIRYDILDPTFLEYMAKVADYGAKKYGDFNWQKSRLTGDKSPINHMYKHINSYQKSELYDHPELGENPEWHLIAIAFNAMMEFFYATSPKIPKGD